LIPLRLSLGSCSLHARQSLTESTKSAALLPVHKSLNICPIQQIFTCLKIIHKTARMCFHCRMYTTSVVIWTLNSSILIAITLHISIVYSPSKENTKANTKAKAAIPSDLSDILTKTSKPPSPYYIHTLYFFYIPYIIVCAVASHCSRLLTCEG